ncbi:MAG: DUF4093 domain-containing protein [Oscillospiraceae bacterium]|nr:DUF4093 domain-containing protein [Oscillospiraceae bacterium]
MVKIREAIVVEGRYDKNALRQVVDTPVFETRGFSVMKDRELIAFLRRVAETRGLIILTDPDGAGFVIRGRLKSAIQTGRVLHAYVPDIAGKEPRKEKPGKEGKLGVEGMRPETLLEALRRAGATFEGEEATREAGTPITKKDLYAVGLTGSDGSAARREQLKQALSLPRHLSTNGLLEALNVLYDRDDFLSEER